MLISLPWFPSVKTAKKARGEEWGDFAPWIASGDRTIQGQALDHSQGHTVEDYQQTDPIPLLLSTCD